MLPEASGLDERYELTGSKRDTRFVSITPSSDYIIYYSDSFTAIQRKKFEDVETFLECIINIPTFGEREEETNTAAEKLIQKNVSSYH